MNLKTDTFILSHEEIQYKIKRMAYQIYESNIGQKDIIIAGITTNGYILASRIGDILTDISDIKVTLCKVEIDATDPTLVNTSVSSEAYKNKSVVLIDDVLDSGKTLIYGIKHFLSTPIRQFKTAVLVNRNHKKYPVKADFKGISLSTSLNEHIRVVLDQKKDAVFLG